MRRDAKFIDGVSMKKTTYRQIRVEYNYEWYTVDVKIEYYDDNNYGADADGNRGVFIREVVDVDIFRCEFPDGSVVFEVEDIGEKLLDAISDRVAEVIND